MLLQIAEAMSNFVAATLFVLLIWSVILYYIIASASRSRNIARIQGMQVKILREIALKNGVDPGKIDDIINEKRGS